MKNICVYCGSGPGNKVEYTEGANALARALAFKKHVAHAAVKWV